MDTRTTGELRRYLGHFAPHRAALVGAGVLLAVSAALPGAAVVLLQRALDAALDPARVAMLPTFAVGFAGLYLLAAGVALARTRVTKGVAWRVATDLRERLHARYLETLPPDRDRVGERLAALTTEVDEVQYGVSALVTAVRNPLTLLVLGATAASLAPRLAPWALLLLPVVWWPSRWGGRRLHARARAVRAARADLLDLAHEQLGGLPVIRDHAAEEAERVRFGATAEADRAARVALEVDRVLPGALVQAGAAVAVALLLWVGGSQVAAGTLEPGALVGFAVALGLMARPLRGLSEVWTLWQRSIASLDRVHTALADLPERPVAGAPEALRRGPLGVSWQGVSLALGGRPVLRGVDLSVRPGEWLALVGPTGAGKSTLLSLVGRHHDPDAGTVRLGGLDVRTLDLRALRRHLAVVRQEPFLFGRTVEENLRLGARDASRAALERAVRQAGAADLVDRLGWDRPLDPRRLSGGERQRLCLARALVLGAPVWLLDEATNQVDPQTAAVVLGAVAARPPGCTVVSVAHDLATARHADRIAVLGDGRVVEEGTHAALLARRGAYAAMWDAHLPARGAEGA